MDWFSLNCSDRLVSPSNPDCAISTWFSISPNKFKCNFASSPINMDCCFNRSTPIAKSSIISSCCPKALFCCKWVMRRFLRINSGRGIGRLPSDCCNLDNPDCKARKSLSDPPMVRNCDAIRAKRAYSLSQSLTEDISVLDSIVLDSTRCMDSRRLVVGDGEQLWSTTATVCCCRHQQHRRCTHTAGVKERKKQLNRSSSKLTPSTKFKLWGMCCSPQCQREKPATH